MAANRYRAVTGPSLRFRSSPRRQAVTRAGYLAAPLAAATAPLSARPVARRTWRPHDRGMYYRVDYNVALLLAGAIAAALASRRVAAVSPRRLARGYLAIIAAIVAIRVVVFVVTSSLGVTLLPPPVGALIGDAGTVLTGAIYGLGIVELARSGGSELLRAPEVRFALCLTTGVSFAVAGVAKAFGMEFMLGFFAQSGYSKSFLFFIMAIEVLGGMALLLPWRWVVVAAIAGLTVDMVGAIATHVHNGDPLDDSTGAIMALLRLVPLALLYVPPRWVAVGAAACTALAIAGGAAARHPAAPHPASSEELAYFVGSWHCAGQFVQTGKPIEADLRGELAIEDRWLVLHHDDRPPGAYHALGAWFRDRTGWTASIADSAGGVRRFRSDGWHGNELIWERSDAAATSDRFVYRRLDDASFEVGYDTRAADAWRRVDLLTCHRTTGG